MQLYELKFYLVNCLSGKTVELERLHMILWAQLGYGVTWFFSLQLQQGFTKCSHFVTLTNAYCASFSCFCRFCF